MTDAGLSPRACARRDALLPALLGAVRARARRRRQRRGLLVAAAVLAVVAVWAGTLRGGRGADAGAPAPPRELVPARPRYVLVADDPGILARCAVPTRVRAEWRLTDAELHAELAAAGRTAGLVRVGGDVFVSPDAVDPFPGASP